MEFWGIEIKPGSPLKVEPEDGYIIHVSQVALGESKKVKDEIVPVFVKVGDDERKLLIGNLSQKIPQVNLDLFFEQEFELSHKCESSSVFLLGYMTPDVGDEQDEEVDSDFDSDEEGIPTDFLNSVNANGLNDQKAKLEEAGESDSDEEDESDSDEMGSDDDEDDSDEEEEEEEEAPLKVEPPSKKRPNGEAMNNTVASKKAKVAIQQKPSGGKKSGKCQGPCGSSCKN